MHDDFSEKIMNVVLELENKIQQNYEIFHEMMQKERDANQFENMKKEKIIENLQKQLYRHEAKLYSNHLYVKGLPEILNENLEDILSNLFSLFEFQNFV